MGRAMLIICSGVLISLGIVGISTSNRSGELTKGTVTYANEITAKNAAHTAIQIAMQEINKDSTWPENHGYNNSWHSTIDGAQTELYAEYLNSNYKTNNFWEPDSLRLVSKAVFANEYESTVNSVYLISPFSNLVPKFKSPLSIATSNFTLTSGGSASIDGNSPSGSGCTEDKPGITVQDVVSDTYVTTATAGIDVDGTERVSTDNTLSYQPTDQLIARLSNTNDVTYLSGSYKGTMGTQENPGVFFVEEPTKLTGGITEGYGIMVVRTNGELGYEQEGTELDIAGNFTFNGLVIFENAYNLDGNGTPTINGSVLVGNTEDYSGTIDIDISGNLNLQYDCRGENYAKKAAAISIKQNKYTRVVTLE